VKQACVVDNMQSFIVIASVAVFISFLRLIFCMTVNSCVSAAFTSSEFTYSNASEKVPSDR